MSNTRLARCTEFCDRVWKAIKQLLYFILPMFIRVVAFKVKVTSYRNSKRTKNRRTKKNGFRIWY
jgi:hypothetical protein